MRCLPSLWRECQVDCPVTYRWYNEYYLPKVDDAKAENDLDKLANLYLKAFIEAGSLPDLVVLGDMARALEEIYLELGYHERLIWLYIEDATTFTYEGYWINEAPRKAYLYAKEIKRPDLELHVMEVFDAENARLHQSKEIQTPLDLVDRKQELVALRDAGFAIKNSRIPWSQRRYVDGLRFTERRVRILD